MLQYLHDTILPQLKIWSQQESHLCIKRACFVGATAPFLCLSSTAPDETFSNDKARKGPGRDKH